MWLKDERYDIMPAIIEPNNVPHVIAGVCVAREIGGLLAMPFGAFS